MNSLITYITKLELSTLERERIVSTLKLQRTLVNFCSEQHFGATKNSIVDLHSKCYYPIKNLYLDVPSQLIIRAEQECLSSYRTAKSNKHKLKAPITKKKLSCRLDKRLYTFPSRDSIRITALGGKRITAKFVFYPKLESLLNSRSVADPLLFVKGKDIWVALSFECPIPLPSENKLAIGVDLGKRNLAVTSDGKLISGREFNKHKRNIRYQKRMFQQTSTKSAKRGLKRLSKREADFSRNYMHHIANEILDTDANVIVLEDLTKIKTKKHRYQNKNNISQVPFYLLRQMVEYKAILRGKETLLCSPAFTSRNDFRGIEPGDRRGCEYKTSDGKVFHSDVNAANNIALKSKLPSLLVDPVNSFRRQGAVNHPIVDSQISLSVREIYKPSVLTGGS